MKKTYKIIFEKKAAKFLTGQTSQQKKRLATAIYRLPDGNVKPIKGYENFYRLRVGDYRVIFTINDNDLIIVLVIGNRGDIYKKYKKMRRENSSYLPITTALHRSLVQSFLIRIFLFVRYFKKMEPFRT